MSTEICSTNMHNQCESRAFYLRSDEEDISVWQHSPVQVSLKNQVVIICPPVGYEYNHSYRSLRRLAEYLCSQGIIVFRFDYQGIGNSAGSVLAKDCLQCWVDNIKNLSDAIDSSFPGFKQCWLGLRLGGTLAMLAAEQHHVDKLVLWEPIVKGRPYILELEALSSLSSISADDSMDYLESAGFLLSNDTSQKIKKLNLIKDVKIPSVSKMLLLQRDDRPVDNSFVEHLQAEGCDAQLTAIAGYADMMAEPQNTRVPTDAIEYVSQWLQVDATQADNASALQLAGAASIKLDEGDAEIEEQPCYFGKDASLFGMLGKPVIRNAHSSSCIIIANSGSVHHVGPNAVYTLISRALVALGYYVFRIDLENIGDSVVVDLDVENHPYQPNATDNIRAAINFVEQHLAVENFIISGICSGAHVAFHVGLNLSDLKISEILLINPLTFYWTPGMSLEIPSSLRMFKDQAYYKQSLRNPEKWKKLFSGKVDIKNITGFIYNRGVALVKQIWSDTQALFLGERTELARDMVAIHDRGITVNFIFSSTDPGLDILKSQAKRALWKGIKERWIALHVIDDADHTFSRKGARDDLLTVLIKHFKRHL